MTKPPANSPPAPARQWDDDNQPWRHPPVVPRDESVAESLGKSVSDVVTGPLDDATGKPMPIPRP